MKHKGRKTGSRLLMLLLTVVMLITAPDASTLAEPAETVETTATTVTAETASAEEAAMAAETEMSETRETETAETEEILPAEKMAVEEEELQPESGEETDNLKDLEDEKILEEEELETSEITETEETESTSSEIETVKEEELEEESAIKADSTSLANPVHHCTQKDDGTDYTDWSYIYFGSYPQSEVIGDALTETITGAAYDRNGDAWINGTKYRRISKSDTSNSFYFGDSTYRYFKWQRIRWRVLQNDGTTLFVAADRGLDCKDYNDEEEAVTWENCTLREWLNNDFYGTAFCSAEQGAVVEQKVLNEDNPSYGIEGGNNTNDKIYLLSVGEVTNSSYGFCENASTFSVSR